MNTVKFENTWHFKARPTGQAPHFPPSPVPGAGILFAPGISARDQPHPAVPHDPQRVMVVRGVCGHGEPAVKRESHSFSHIGTLKPAMCIDSKLGRT